MKFNISTDKYYKESQRKLCSKREYPYVFQVKQTIRMYQVINEAQHMYIASTDAIVDISAHIVDDYHTKKKF